MTERRYPYIRKHIKSKSVLDIGCVEHNPSNSAEEYWLHDKIRRDAASTVGLDLVEAPELNEQGYDIRVADACDFDFDETFGAIVAGELIEHIDDFDGFLSSVKSHLSDGGKLILTTPNAMSILYSVKRALLGDFVNGEHTCWFGPQTIRQLLSRHGFETTEIELIRHGTPTKDLLQTTQWLTELVLPDEIGAQTMVIVARPTDQPCAVSEHVE